MPTRRRLLIISALTVLALVAAGYFLIVGRDLRSRSAPIKIGMSAEEVKAILGPPALDLPIVGGKGMVLVWVDQFWQLDVRVGTDSRVQTIRCVPSNSAFRRTMNRLK